MRKVLLTTAAFGLCFVSNPAKAGFEFEPAPKTQNAPVRLEQAPVPPPAGILSIDPMPVSPVESQPLSPAPMSIVPQKAVVQPNGLVINPYPNQGRAQANDEASLLQEMLKESGSLNPLPQTSSQVLRAQVTPISPVRKSSFPEIQGFGRDLPLVIALSQIVPANYTYTFQSQANAGVNASWQGGKPWDQVLQDMLRPLDLGASIRNNVVFIKQGASPQRDFVKSDVVQTPPVSVPQPLPKVTPQAPQKTIEPKPVQYDHAMISRSSDIVSNYTKLDSSKRPVVPARISRLRGGLEEPVLADRVEDLPLPPSIGSPLPAVEQEVVVAPSPEPLQPVQIVPEPVKAVSSPEIVEFPEAEEPVLVSMPLQSDGEMNWSAPSQLKMVSNSAMVGSLDKVRTWRAVRGDSLKTVLTDWAMDAGVELYWSSEFDYPLDSSVRMKGTFEEATQNILTGLRDARPRPIGRLHPNDPEGPAVLVIETQQIVE